MVTKKSMGSRLRAAREKLGITQDEFAERTGKSRVSIANYETGRRGIPVGDLPLLAEALGVPISYFFGDVEPNEELATLFNALSLEKKKQALAYMRFLLYHPD